MRLLTLVFFYSFTLLHQSTDQERFFKNYHSVLVKVQSLGEMADEVRFNNGHECPELILFIFSAKGKQVYISPFGRQEFYQYLKARHPDLPVRATWCVLMKNSAYYYRLNEDHKRNR